MAATRDDQAEGQAMYCTQCGQRLPTGARFCPACGTAVGDMVESADKPGRAPAGDRSAADATGEVSRTTDEVTTGAIEVGALDEHAHLDDLPELEPGTGMLVVVRGPGAGSRYLLDRDLTSIGRHPDSHIFLDDVTVSRRHAEVEREGGELSVRDLGSLNGTYVNGQRVEQRHLATNDEVQVGRFKLLFVGSTGRSPGGA